MVVVTVDSLDTILGSPIRRGVVTVFYRVGYKPYLGDQDVSFPARTEVQIVAGALAGPLVMVPTGTVCYAAITVQDQVTGRSLQLNATIPPADVDYDDLVAVDPSTFLPVVPLPPSAQEVLDEAAAAIGSAAAAEAARVAAVIAEAGAVAAAESVIPSTDAAMTAVGADPETEFAKQQMATIDAAVVPAAAEAMGNPETALNAATVDVVEGVIGGGLANLVRVERGTLTNIATARPVWAGVVDWYINEGSNLPLHIAAGDVWTVVAAAPYVPPTPLEIFGSSLVSWWDERLTPPTDGADYGTLYDRATVPHNMVPLTTGMSDIPQYDADGINGKPSVYQPAISSMGATIPTTGTGAVTVIIGVQLGAADGTAHYVTNGDNNSTPRLSIAANSASDGWLIRRGGTVRSGGSIIGGRSVPHALIAMYNGDSSAFWDNGVKTAGILTPGTIASTTFKVGALQDVAGNVQPAPGMRFVSPIIVNRAITDSEAALVTAFIKSRLGI